MSILESDIERVFQAFCKTMISGDAEWAKVIKELDFDAGTLTVIRAELRKERKWIREREGGIYAITRKGLRAARRLGILSQAEYEEKKYQIFDR